VTSVCTGALVLGAAGLLSGYRATTHWAFTDLLASAPRMRPGASSSIATITGGGVTAGIDFGLVVAAELAGERAAKSIQLSLEYNPEPPFACGHPSTADADLVAAVRERLAQRGAARFAPTV
jgi:cyclohexyl-isocyanide hydratase